EHNSARWPGPTRRGRRAQRVSNLRRGVRADAQQPQNPPDHIRVDIDPPAPRVPVPGRDPVGGGKLVKLGIHMAMLTASASNHAGSAATSAGGGRAGIWVASAACSSCIAAGAGVLPKENARQIIPAKR